MTWLGIVLLGLVLIPVLAILIDSPIVRALARRVEGPVDAAPPPVLELAKKVQLLEEEMDDLHRTVQQLQEESQFLQKLLGEGEKRPSLPPGKTP